MDSYSLRNSSPAFPNSGPWYSEQIFSESAAVAGNRDLKLRLFIITEDHASSEWVVVINYCDS